MMLGSLWVALSAPAWACCRADVVDEQVFAADETHFVVSRVRNETLPRTCEEVVGLEVCRVPIAGGEPACAAQEVPADTPVEKRHEALATAFLTANPAFQKSVRPAKDVTATLVETDGLGMELTVTHKGTAHTRTLDDVLGAFTIVPAVPSGSYALPGGSYALSFDFVGYMGAHKSKHVLWVAWRP